MKKILHSSFIFLVLLVIFGLSSCSNDDALDKTGNNQDSKVYSVSFEESDYYTIGGTINSTSGNICNVQVTSLFSACEIVGCTYNGNECAKGDDIQYSKTFTYTMPSNDVEIKVSLNWLDTETSGKGDFLSFDSTNTYTFTAGSLEDFVLEFNTNASFMTIAEFTCFSVNENVLPNDAISVVKKEASNSNMIVGGSIYIDGSKAKAGTTKIVLRVKNGNSMSYDGIIVATITFSEN